jgi:hypothetical protein
MAHSDTKIRSMKGTFNKQTYFNAVVKVSLLSEMKKGKLSPEDCNMIFAVVSGRHFSIYDIEDAITKKKKRKSRK